MICRWAGVTGSSTASTGMVNADADADGKPVYTGLTGNAIHVESTSSFASWYHDAPDVNHATSGKLVLWKNDPCGPCRSLADQVFEPENAPELPLVGCGNMYCNCRYEPVIRE